MDGYVIGMTANSSPIEGQHLKQQNILFYVSEKQESTRKKTKLTERKAEGEAVVWQLTTDI